MLLFNRYQYQPSTDLIGRGELTRVYKALDKQIYLPVALKIYRGSDPLDKVGLINVKKFIAMDHPNICRYLHIEDVEKDGPLGEKERTQVCVMELVPDGDFGNYYRDRKDHELLRKMVIDILRGVTYLHSKGIVHRRLKPSNLLVGETTQGPVVKITDFGLGSGKAALRDARLSSVVVEVTHMAPEQFNPRKYGINGKISYHLDFWAIGLVIYEALTNNDILFKNYPDESREQVMQNILAPTLPEKIKRLPSPFDKVVARCLAKQVDERVQNTRELLELLAEPITLQDDIYETVVLPAMARQEEEDEGEEPEGFYPSGDVLTPVKVAPIVAAPVTSIVATPAAPVVATPAVVKETSDALVRNEETHTLFNRYEYNPKTGFIGKGGFSRVYKALDKKLSRWVALKLYKTGEVADRYSPFAEIRRVINLDHPNICRYLDIEEMEKENAFGEKEVTQICVMELLDGGNLHEYYTAHRTDEVLKKLLTDVLKGLEYLHKNNIIHRDIKPANILIKEGYDGPVAKITDFGISKLSDSINQHSSSALVVSIPYMAPEQLNVKKYGIGEKISYNLDLWSLGVTIYEIISGQVLFKNSERDTSEQIMTNIMAPELPEKINELPQPFLDIVRRCVVKDARERVQGADELIELLHRAVEVTPVVVAPEVEAAAVVAAAVIEAPAVVDAAAVAETPAVVEAAAPVTVESAVPPVVEAVSEPVMAEPLAEAPAAVVVIKPEEVAMAVKTPIEEMPVEVVKTPQMRVEVPEVAEEEMPEYITLRSGPSRGKIIALRIAIAVVAILLGVSLYTYFQNQSQDLPYTSGNTDSVGGGVKTPATTAAAAPATAKTPAVNPPVDSAKTKNAVTTTDGTGKKSHHRHAPPDAAGTDGAGTVGAGASGTKEAGTVTGGSHSPGAAGTETTKYVLLLSTPTSCSININNAPYGVLESGKTMKVYLSPGNYIIQATSTSNSSAVYTGRLVVEENNLNQVGKYKIPL
jgi:serine/threonine protein kinase